MSFRYIKKLDLEFKIIALSETGIHKHHAVYNITHYNLEMDYRHKRRATVFFNTRSEKIWLILYS